MPWMQPYPGISFIMCKLTNQSGFSICRYGHARTASMAAVISASLCESSCSSASSASRASAPPVLPELALLSQPVAAGRERRVSASVRSTTAEAAPPGPSLGASTTMSRTCMHREQNKKVATKRASSSTIKHATSCTIKRVIMSITKHATSCTIGYCCHLSGSATTVHDQYT